MTLGLMDRVIKTKVDREIHHDSDHLPISISLDLRVLQHQHKPRRNWKNLDDKKFCEALEETLPTLARPRTRAALDTYTEEVAKTVSTAAAKVLPLTRYSPKAR